MIPPIAAAVTTPPTCWLAGISTSRFSFFIPLFCRASQYFQPKKNRAMTKPRGKLPSKLKRWRCGSPLAKRALALRTRYKNFQPKMNPTAPCVKYSMGETGPPVSMSTRRGLKIPKACLRSISRRKVNAAATNANATKSPKLLIIFSAGISHPKISRNAWYRVGYMVFDQPFSMRLTVLPEAYPAA